MYASSVSDLGINVQTPSSKYSTYICVQSLFTVDSFQLIGSNLFDGAEEVGNFLLLVEHIRPVSKGGKAIISVCSRHQVGIFMSFCWISKQPVV